MQNAAIVRNIDAYLEDIAYTAKEAASTVSPMARILCIKVLCAQTETLADLAGRIDLGSDRSVQATAEGHLYDFA